MDPCAENSLLFTQQLSLLEGTAPLKEQIRAATARVKHLERMSSLDYAKYQKETSVLEATIRDIRLENMDETSRSTLKTSIAIVLDETQAKLDKTETKLDVMETELVVTQTELGKTQAKLGETQEKLSTLEEKQRTKIVDYMTRFEMETYLNKYDQTVSDQIEKRKYILESSTKIMNYRKAIKDIASINYDLFLSDETTSFLRSVALHQSSTQEDSLKYLAQLPKPPKEPSLLEINVAKEEIRAGSAKFKESTRLFLTSRNIL